MYTNIDDSLRYLEEFAPYFTFEELCHSIKAGELGIDNVCKNKTHILNLRLLTDYLLIPTRKAFEMPMMISSGYRCEQLNKAVNGAPRSQHLQGCAADFVIPGVDNIEVCYWMSEYLNFDQIILENYRIGQPNSGWIHASYSQEENRRQLLTKDIGKPYTTGLPQKQYAPGTRFGLKDGRQRRL